MTAPIVSWYEGTNAVTSEVVSTVNYGAVDADTASPTKTFYIWNNRDGTEALSKMQEVKFTTRDRTGGLGDIPGNVVEAVKDNWFRVRVDTLGESAFTTIGKGGVGTSNPSGVKAVGTSGSTTNPNSTTAAVWSLNTPLSLGTYVQPTIANGYIYKVVAAGITDGTQPTWSTVEGESVFDGTVEYNAIKIVKTPAAEEILGEEHKTLANGSNANLAAGNFVQVSVYAEVPITASAGKNLLVQRVTYQYL